LKEHGTSDAPGKGFILVLSGLAVIALFVFGFWGRPGKAKLYFADRYNKALTVETRDAPLLGSMEERAQELMSDLLLGPMEPNNQPLIQGDARLGTVMRRGAILNVDIEIVDLVGQKLPFGLVKRAIEQSLGESVPGAGRLDLYINGHKIDG